jgi:hypothetical protein
MQVDTDRDEDELDDYDAPVDFAGLDDSSAYWRRRFIILAGGIAALGLCVWLFPGSHPAAARTSAAARASAAALASGSALTSTAYGTAWPGLTAKASSTPSPSPSPSPKAPATVKASHSAAAKSGKRRKAKTPATAMAGAAREPRCAPADIVLSLFTSQASYAQNALPSFSVYAVSTSATACALTYGPGSVRVIVTRHGHVVWDSAACKPPAARAVRFTLGVPRALTMSWKRQATTPSGCAGSLPAGAGGTFDAVAMTAGQSSLVHTFKLDR